MVQIYADGALVYDSRLPDRPMTALTTTKGVNVGGTATFTMPPNHPAYGAFTAFRTIVEIYRDGKLHFRGRPLPPVDDFYNMRTVTCVGERCFFADAVSRPYLYQDTPAAIFTALVEAYNSQVEAFKQFRLGTITVTDANDYVRLESESPESIMATLDKLVERCGGYVVFTSATDGARVVNWYAELGYRSSQVIEFGANLLDFSRDGANTALATGIYPLGAVDEATGERITIESVNDGADVLMDEEAQQLRGTIIRPVVWEDVTEPANLLRKAQQWLSENRVIITSLRLSAVDLSLFNKSIDSFMEGDTIRVQSKPHQVDEDFLLTDLTEDLLNPANGVITLGKDKRTLTSADVAGDDKSMSELHKVVHNIKSDYTLNIAQAVAQTEQTLTSLIEQTSEAIRLAVSETYATNDQVKESVETTLSVYKDQVLIEFETLREVVDANATDTRQQFETLSKYIEIKNGVLTLGDRSKPLTLSLENDLIVFRSNGQQIGWWDGVDFHTGNIVIEVTERAQFGNFAFVPRSNGSLSFLKVGG